MNLDITCIDDIFHVLDMPLVEKNYQFFLVGSNKGQGEV